MWGTQARQAIARRVSSSGLVVSGVVVMVVLATAGFVVGRADTALHLLVHPGDAWLSSTRSGSVSLVDGQSGRSSAELLLSGSRGHYLVVSQTGETVLVRDTRTGMLMRINTAQLARGAAVRTPRHSVVVAGLAATYVVDYSAGIVQRIDPVTLAPLGPLVRVPGVLGPTAVVDRNGRLWVPVLSNGTVVPVTSSGVGTPVHVGSGGADVVLTTAGGVPIAVDRTSRRLTAVGVTGARLAVTLPASAVAGGSRALLVPAAGTSGSLPLVNPNGSPSLVLVDLHRGTTRSIPLGAEVTGHTLGNPVQAGQRVFIPDFTTGSVLVYNTTAGALATTIPVTGHRGTFETQVIDGIAYFNNPGGNSAVVVTPDGQVHQVSKSGPGVPTARRSPAPAPAPAPVTAPSPAPGGPSAGPGPGHGAPGPGPGRGTPGPGPRPRPSAPGHRRQPKPSPKPKPSPSRSLSPSPSPPPTTPPGVPPLAPQNPQSAPGPGYVDVSWQPPASGGPVSSYSVSVSPTAGTPTRTGATSVRITGLSCGTAYGFTVSSVGPGGQQVPAQPVTARPCVPPGTPSGLTSAVSPGQIQLSWSAPASDGGGPVSYTVTWGGGSQTVATTGTTIGGLTNFQPYNVSVTAVNPAGAGGAATASMTLAPAQPWAYNIYNNSADAVNVRSAPSTGAGILGSFPPNSNAGVSVVCQLAGGYYQDPSPSHSPSGDIWDRIVYGGGYGYVADGYVTTPNSMGNGFSSPIWPCQ